MSSISGPPTINPLDLARSRPERSTVVIHEFPPTPLRPGVEPSTILAQRDPRRPGHLRQGGTGRHHLEESSWLDVAERVLHAWPITLRLAVLTIVLATGTAVTAAVVGVVCQLALAALGIRARIRRRGRVRALQARKAMLEQPGAAPHGAG